VSRGVHFSSLNELVVLLSLAFMPRNFISETESLLCPSPFGFGSVRNQIRGEDSSQEGAMGATISRSVCCSSGPEPQHPMHTGRDGPYVELLDTKTMELLSLNDDHACFLRASFGGGEVHDCLVGLSELVVEQWLQHCCKAPKVVPSKRGYHIPILQVPERDGEGAMPTVVRP
jgi:hypothetical protein